jgi:hypothetical protein
LPSFKFRSGTTVVLVVIAERLPTASATNHTVSDVVA